MPFGIFGFIRLVLLVSLVKLLLSTEKPFLCSGLYALLYLVLGFLFGCSLVTVLISSAIVFAVASVYFWALDRFEGAGLLWWVILIGGLVIALVV